MIAQPHYIDFGPSHWRDMLELYRRLSGRRHQARRVRLYARLMHLFWLILFTRNIAGARTGTTGRHCQPRRRTQPEDAAALPRLLPALLPASQPAPVAHDVTRRTSVAGSSAHNAAECDCIRIHIAHTPHSCRASAPDRKQLIPGAGWPMSRMLIPDALAESPYMILSILGNQSNARLSTPVWVSCETWPVEVIHTSKRPSILRPAIDSPLGDHFTDLIVVVCPL